MVPHMPVTRVCVATISSGVPFGMHVAWLSISKTGIPFDITRVAALIHWAVTQGIGAPETLKGHPAITYGAGCITIGWPAALDASQGE